MPELPSLHSASFERIYHEEHDPAYLIVKGNRIVQHAHYSMPLADQKVLASLIRSIKPDQKSLTVKFSTKQYMKMLGLRSSGTTFDSIMHTLYHILNDNFFILRPDGKYESWVWLDKVIADPKGKGRGNFLVRFKPELRKYLFNKSKKYRTIYKFSDIMLMKSKFSPRLYEIFRSNQSKQKVQKRGLNYGISELKIGLNLMIRDKRTGKIKKDSHGHIKFRYPRFANFNNRVLKPAEHEINLLTEYNIRMKQIRRHRKTKYINVVMLKKNKKELRKRDDVIFCITHHVPKSRWSTVREDIIKGRFHKVKPRNRKKKNQSQAKHNKEIVADYKVVKPKDKSALHKSDRNTSTVKSKSFGDKSTKEQLNKLDDYLGKHKIPFKEVNISGDKLEYYSPLVDKYIWTTRYMRNKQMKVYNAQKTIMKQLHNEREEIDARGRIKYKKDKH